MEIRELVPDLNQAQLEKGQCDEIPGGASLLVQVGSLVQLGHFLQLELQPRSAIKLDSGVV